MRFIVSVSLCLGLCVCVPGCSKDSGVESGPSTPEQRVEQALQEFATALQEGAPIIAEMELALQARLTDADASIILQQYVHMIEAAGRHEAFQADPEFIELMGRMSDLPYFSVFSQALSDETQSAALSLTPRSGSLATAHQALSSSQKCSSDCAMTAIVDYAGETGMSLLGTFFNELDLISNGIACTDQLAESYACLAKDQCGRVDLINLGSSCLQVGGAFATVGASPLVAGAVAISGALVGALVSRRNVNKAVTECETFQAENCCVAQIPCGEACCQQGFACLPGSICSRTAAAGCLDKEKPCGIYCCSGGQVCNWDSGLCEPAAQCEPPMTACGSSCCAVGEECSLDGHCENCSNQPLCGGTVCCRPGTFCNVIGQCMPEPQGGCDSVCGMTCCAEGQTCMDVEGVYVCAGESAVCPDGTCAEGLESPLSCPQDCPSLCGDETCQDWELESTCPEDCPEREQVEPDEDTTSGPGDDAFIEGACAVAWSCGDFCAKAEEMAFEACAEMGGTPMGEFQTAACVSACGCLQAGDCGNMLSCVFDYTCPGCQESVTSCESLFQNCGWGAWLKCAIGR